MNGLPRLYFNPINLEIKSIKVLTFVMTLNTGWGKIREKMSADYLLILLI